MKYNFNICRKTPYAGSNPIASLNSLPSMTRIPIHVTRIPICRFIGKVSVLLLHDIIYALRSHRTTSFRYSSYSSTSLILSTSLARSPSRTDRMTVVLNYSHRQIILVANLSAYGFFLFASTFYVSPNAKSDLKLQVNSCLVEHHVASTPTKNE